jgi:hypothetical protein
MLQVPRFRLQGPVTNLSATCSHPETCNLYLQQLQYHQKFFNLSSTGNWQPATGNNEHLTDFEATVVNKGLKFAAL